ncbi:MAG: vitamin K epoxide reductase family protein [Gemmatimonadota bacterium]|nr:vitamin K epoxide reductase family protein [Gemmatimonadota bacterium]
MSPRRAIALLSLLGLFVALYLTLYHMGLVGALSCSVGSCETVQSSKYAMFMGMPVAALGLGAYVVLLAMAMAGLQLRWEESMTVSRALAAVSGVGFVFSVWLTYLELFVIHAICQWCVISAILMTLIFVASLIDNRRETSDVSSQKSDVIADGA